MENTGYIALSRQMAVRREMNTVANNIANANTPGYQSQATLFVDWLTKVNSGERLTFTRTMSFNQDFGLVRNTQSGALQKTNNDFDLAIQGEGYFTVETPLGERYTRNGRVMLNAEGTLVTPLGMPILDENGQEIQVPNNAITMNAYPDGTLTATVPNLEGGVPTEQDVGRIQIVTFENQQEMRMVDNSMFTGAGEPIDAEDSALVQGMIENSNVNPILELTKMIEVSRTFGRGQQLMETEHDRMRRAIQVLTRRAE